MKNSFLGFILCLSATLCMACSDDASVGGNDQGGNDEKPGSEKPGTNEGEQPTTCASDDECHGEYTCFQSSCVIAAHIDEACGSGDRVCVVGECVANTCVMPEREPVVGDACTKHDDCGESLVCVEHACSERLVTGSRCRDDAACVSGLCHERVCSEYKELDEPCGTGNPSPLFVLEGANVTAVRGVGAGKHCRLAVEAGGRHFSAMYFNVTPSELACEKGDSVDLLFGVGINRYMGKKELQLTVEDVRPSAFALACRRAERARFEDIMSGGSFSADEGFMPSRRDLVNLYSIICALAECGRVSVSDKYALYLLRTKLPERESVGYVKYKLMVEIFAATGIFKIRKTECEDEVTSFETLEHKTKIDIEKSELFVRLKHQCLDAH